MSQKKAMFGPYGDARSLAEKIDYEGFDYFFTNHADQDEFVGTPIYDEVLDYIGAAWALREKLRSLGAGGLA